MSFKKIKTEAFVALGKLICRMPLAMQMALGRVVGRLFNWLPNKRKQIAEANITHCFSGLGSGQQDRLVKANLISTGQGVSEMMAALWARDAQVADKFEIRGLPILKEAMSSGQGCLLLSCHTTSIEWGIRGLNHALKQAGLPVGHMLARANNNKQLEAHYTKAREGFVEKVIDKKDIRSLLKSIKSGHGVYYAPDQNFSYQCEFIPFFGQAAATAIGPVKLVRSAKLNVIPWFCFRTGPTSWVIDICPEFSGMRESSVSQALSEMNQLFEKKISQYPEQYLWVHRRFKNQPEGKDSIY